MDNFCNVLDDNQGRCSCSANLSNYAETEEALKQATEDLQDVALQIQYIGLTADEVETLFTQTEAATEWNVAHNWGTWCIVQTYGSDGDQLMADVVQSQDLNSVKIGFGSAKTGSAVLISGGSFDNVNTLSGTGRAKRVSLGAARMLRLNEASGTWVVQHDKGRLVVVQVYDQSGNEIKADVIQDMTTLNSVTIRFSRAVSGTAVIV